MGQWPSWWSRARLLVWSTIGFLVLLSGVVSSRPDMIVLGTVWLFAATSAYLAFYVKSEHRVRRTLEVIFALLALGVAVYGYVVTGSFILGVVTLLIVIMGFIALLLSYLLPKIRRESRGYSRDM